MQDENFKLKSALYCETFLSHQKNDHLNDELNLCVDHHLFEMITSLN